MADRFPYEDIVGLPRPVSKKHGDVPMSDRAARFSPFAAITGYEEMVLEAARVTEEKAELSEDEKARLNHRLCVLATLVAQAPLVTVTYFEPDGKKAGGAYVRFAGEVRRVDECGRCVVFWSGERISFDDIFELEGECF